MAAAVDYSALLKAAAAEPPPSVRARADRGWLGKGGSEPRRWKCSDDHEYAVKHPNNPQVVSAPQLLATEFVVARVGLAFGAPVFPCAVVDVTPELVQGLQYRGGTTAAIDAGRSFGSQIRDQDDVGDQDTAPSDWKTSPVNKRRVAALCILHALFILGDSFQFVVKKTSPFELWSIDHGFFIAGGGAWPSDLGTQIDVSDIPTDRFSEFSLAKDDLVQAALPLLQLSDNALAALIAPMPAEWAPSPGLRAGCLQFVCERREKIRSLLGVDSEEEPAEEERETGEGMTAEA